MPTATALTSPPIRTKSPFAESARFYIAVNTTIDVPVDKLHGDGVPRGLGCPSVVLEPVTENYTWVLAHTMSLGTLREHGKVSGLGQPLGHGIAPRWSATG